MPRFRAAEGPVVACPAGETHRRALSRDKTVRDRGRKREVWRKNRNRCLRRDLIAHKSSLSSSLLHPQCRKLIPSGGPDLGGDVVLLVELV